MKYALLGLAGLGGIALSGCGIEDAIRVAQNIANAAPQTCAGLQQAGADVQGWAQQVGTANTGNKAINAAVAKVNAGKPLADKDCAVLAAQAPKIVEILKASAVVASGFKF